MRQSKSPTEQMLLILSSDYEFKYSLWLQLGFLSDVQLSVLTRTAFNISPSSGHMKTHILHICIHFMSLWLKNKVM